MPKKQRGRWDFDHANDIKEIVVDLVGKLGFDHIKTAQLFCVRSSNSVTRAYARIWGLSRIFQVTAGYSPTYVIEVLSQHFDKLSEEEKKKVLIHELLHIPKTFSGALLSHRGRYHRVDHRTVDELYKKFIMIPKRRLW